MKVNQDSENLEKALDKKPVEISKEDNLKVASEIGYHKGSLNTLVNERNELIKMIQVVESIMQAHIQRLEELGVKIKKE